MSGNSCKVCSKNLASASGKKGIAIACDAWHCYTCLGITKKLFEAINEFTADNDSSHIFI